MLYEKIRLEDDERVLLIARRHWFLIALRALGILITASLPFVLFAAASSFDPATPFVRRAMAEFWRELWFFAALWLLLHWMLFVARWTDWYLDVWIVTDRRIIAIDQRALFVREVGSFRLERLQDINIVIPGFLATMFDYGNIEVQTASDDTFVAHGLPHPREVKATILEAADRRLRAMGHNTGAGI